MMARGLPGPWDNAPEVPGDGLRSYRAFWALNTDRPSGFGAVRIPWSRLDRYATRHHIEGEAFEELETMIRAMDDVFMLFHKPKPKEETAKPDDPEPQGGIETAPSKGFGAQP